MGSEHEFGEQGIAVAELIWASLPASTTYRLQCTWTALGLLNFFFCTCTMSLATRNHLCLKSYQRCLVIPRYKILIGFPNPWCSQCGLSLPWELVGDADLRPHTGLPLSWHPGEISGDLSTHSSLRGTDLGSLRGFWLCLTTSLDGENVYTDTMKQLLANW